TAQDRGMNVHSGAVGVLLESSAALDTADHKIFLNSVKNLVVRGGTALYWFSCNLSNRFVSCVVPQGSDLDLFLLSAYLLPRVCHRFTTVSHHSYADDSQFYVSVTPEPGILPACLHWDFVPLCDDLQLFVVKRCLFITLIFSSSISSQWGPGLDSGWAAPKCLYCFL
uniref:Uncharacterized protein n=1 Tax=Stegastes partitus TaxID=144197 RepID=A0A3B5BA74_9TELE